MELVAQFGGIYLICKKTFNGPSMQLNLPMLVKKITHTFKKLEQELFPEHRYYMSDAITRGLSNQNLVVADVGAAYGTDPRWNPVRKLAKFITFEPDSRSQNYTVTDNTTNFSTGLAKTKSQQTLYLTKLPAASSLYPINTKEIQNFATKDWHEIVGSTSIELDTLDNCLEVHPELKPDFIKIDVEGADLDVLKGGICALDNSVLGLQIEVSFIERHVGAPLFAETDMFLREHNFSLFILSREHWLRKNLAFGPNSNPQLIWGDAVYFLKKEKFFEKLDLIEKI